MALKEEEFATLLSLVSRIESTDQMARLREAVTSRQTRIGQATLQALRVGTTVSWTGKHGHKTGTVVKIKQKYVDVEVQSQNGKSMTWIVPAAIVKVEK